MRNSVLEELRVRRLADIQEKICCRVVWRWATLESRLRGWNEKKVEYRLRKDCSGLFSLLILFALVKNFYLLYMCICATDFGE